ncbi:AraC family transcriptional regulator [Betaproteobacteria bacterium PRO7]|jgi:transcriptional regulator GlxA family with amidase domain|nr:AraC family transcriptional regulator [Betaproteobacteria bacterium PRO7]
MRIAIVTFDGFNEIDSFVVFHLLNRAAAEGWRAEIVGPSAEVRSLNGVRVAVQQPLESANDADAVLFGSGRLTRQLVEDTALLSRLRLDPRRQLIGAQCSGALFLAKLGVLGGLPVCTDMKTRPFVEAAGVRVLDRSFFASGNVASAGGCLASPCLATWTIWRLLGRDAAAAALEYVAPVGERERFVAQTLDAVAPFVESAKVESAVVGG